MKKLNSIVLGVVLLIAAFTWIPGYGQTAQSLISINLKEARLTQALNEINSKSGNQILYKVEEASKETKLITVNLKDVSPVKCVEACLAGTGFTYVLQGGMIVVHPKKQDEQPQKPVIHILKGTVTDISGRPMEGVAVMVKGTSTGIATDNKGYYELKTPRFCTVVYAFLGMKKREVVIRGDNEQNIIMELDAAEVGEVVVTGVFNKSKESYTGSVSTVTAKDIQAYRGQNLVQTLKNIDPAFNITVDNNLGSNPNVIPQLTLRGSSSLPMSVQEYNAGLKTNVNTPLIIMDGFEISLTKLMDYNDEDIETINILKDASATAIYGSRGANGVIVVITKAPQPGKLKINVQAGLTMEIPDISSYDLLNASELLSLQKQVGLYTSKTNLSYKEYGEAAYELRLKDVMEGVNTDWLHYPVRVGTGRKYNLRLEGGSNEFRWGATASLTSNAGAMKGSDRDNFNAGFTIAYTYKNVIFKNQLRVGVNKATESSYGNFSTYANMMPYYKPYNEDGTLVKDFMGLITTYARVQNPLYDATLNSRNETGYTELNNNFSIEWNILKELKMKAQLGITKNNTEKDYYLPAEHSTFRTSEYETQDGYFRRGMYKYGTGNSLSYDADVVLSYTKNFKGKHQLYAGLNYSIQNSENYMYNFVVEGFSKGSKAFIGNALQYDKLGMPNGIESTSRRVGLTGNLNYTFENRYYADFSYRVDGSSQFGSKSKYAPFWSMGIGWNIHREKFLRGNDLISNFRLKASYGQTGSQQFSPYQALQTYQYYTDDRYLNMTGAYLMALGNVNLKWQMTDQFNIGTEIGILNNRLSGTFDFYVKKTSDLLSSRDLPLSTGYSSYIDNIGEVKNTGFEASLNGYIFRDTEKGLIWMVGAKLAYNKNQISRLSEEIKKQTESYRAQNVDISTLFYEGFSQNSIWAVKSLGIDPSTGKELFLDKNGYVTDTWDPSAKIYCGISDPLFRGNVNSMLRYGNFTLNLSFGYHWGGQVYNQTLISKVEVTTTVLGKNNVDKRVYTERWSKPGDIAFYKGFSNTATRATSRFVMNDKVFELQSASLQYRLDKGSFIKKYKIQSLIFEVNTSDIFYISSVKRERGISYPFSRRAGVSVSLMF
ncbi:MAG: SusC/RagA family TonB-linked outer membrane protein [Bacteroidales bacterium]|jgi:TonB-linked SusC/RagA family outer membrane protein